jgi:hypothetical protein
LKFSPPFSVKNVWKTNSILHHKLCWKTWISQPLGMQKFKAKVRICGIAQPCANLGHFKLYYQPPSIQPVTIANAGKPIYFTSISDDYRTIFWPHSIWAFLDAACCKKLMGCRLRKSESLRGAQGISVCSTWDHGQCSGLVGVCIVSQSHAYGWFFGCFQW